MLDSEKKELMIQTLKNKVDKQILYYLDICARCAICRDACHQYKITKDPKYIPAYRAELIRRLYKKYFSVLGRMFPNIYEAKEVDDEFLLSELYQVAYACTGCRRCMYYCPFSIDTLQILSVAKAILLSAGMGNQILQELSDAAIAKGENIGIFKDIFVKMLKESEPEIREKIKDKNAEIPIDKKNADVLYVALSGMHSILPAAIIFNKAKINWTLSMFEAENYGYFLGDSEKAKTIADRIVKEAERLNVKEVVITECGHAYRVINFFYEAWTGQAPPFKVTALIDAISRYAKEGLIEVNKNSSSEIVTYHDPCQVGRNAGFFDEPRYLINSITDNFRELTPNRTKSWCCGGGGGLVAIPEMDEFRIKTGEIKANQIKEVQAGIVISTCENCRLQINSLNERYELNIKVKSMMEFVAENLKV
ncbi:MAG: (Fe-S)-binding protein [Actinomycetota bacterium]|nr:(Fe-S)-binding protein [Actinomycetota bacterium]